MHSKANKANPEKLMILMFPLITLGLFMAGIVILHYLPVIFGT